MTASFPWYDLPCVRWANDAIWQAMVRGPLARNPHGTAPGGADAGEPPAHRLGGRLDRATPVEAQWRARDLVVSQACGLDLFMGDAPIEPVLAPVFDLDCEEGRYYSYLVGSRGNVAAVNSMTSRSGLSALLTVCEPASLCVTGSHEASLAAVREGLADMACIDAVTWHILERDVPSSVRGLRVLERTCSAPAPPYVVPKARRVVRKAGRRDDLVPLITAAMEDPATLLARQALLIRGVIPVTFADYAPVLTEYRAIAERIPDSVVRMPQG